MYLNSFQKNKLHISNITNQQNPNNIHKISLYNIKQSQKELNRNVKNSQQINTTQQH